MNQLSRTVEPSRAIRGPVKICLAGSGGGHVRQLLDLEPAWAGHDAFFVTEDTALSRSLSQKHQVHFVAHVALGQARLGAPFLMLRRALSNFVQSALIAFRERPDVVISTGAGAVYFTVLWARLLGAKVVLIDSFARFRSLSAFARIAGPLAHEKIVQSPALAQFWPDAKVFDPLRILTEDAPSKEPLLFATVGATLPFDRLVDAVAKLKSAGEIPEMVIVQTGVGGAQPTGIETFESIEFDAVHDLLRRADVVVCHGGSGSLITALRHGCRVVAMPRSFSRGEHYDNHQEEITAAFEARGLIAVAHSPEQLAEALQLVRSQRPVLATLEPAELIEHLRRLIAGWTRPLTRDQEERPRSNAAPNHRLDLPQID